MAEFSKRAQVTIETMGKVHNPSGEGIAPFSKDVKKKTEKAATFANATASTTSSLSSTPTRSSPNKKKNQEAHPTMKVEEGSSRRNITRKKTDPALGGRYDSRTKKQGGAGKGKWLAKDDPMLHGLEQAQAEANDIREWIDEEDPLYVAEEDAAPSSFVLTSQEGAALRFRQNGEKPSAYDAANNKAVFGPMLTLSEFKIRVADAIREYFDSSDEEEVVRCIDEMKCRDYHSEVVKRAISLSLDEGPRERELLSRLLTCLHPNPLTDEEMEMGFELLLDSIEDLVIDIPDAKAMVGSFLARAVVDEVLTPAFLSNRNNTHPGDPVVERAVGLLSREHCTARLEKIWGPGDGRPVSELKELMDQLLKEYLFSMELDEAASCVRELNASHFHHELVKRGVKIAMEEDGRDHASGSSSLDAIAALFRFLVCNSIVSEYQVAKGVSRLRKILPDLKLDVPAAEQMLDEFEDMAREGDFLHVPSEEFEKDYIS